MLTCARVVGCVIAESGHRVIASIGVGQVGGGSWNSKVKSALGQHRRHLFHALQRLDAALRLLGLGGLGLEAVDELLQVGDLVLLLVEAPPVAAPALGTLLLEAGVVAAVARELGAVQVQGDVGSTASRNSRSWLMTSMVPG